MLNSLFSPIKSKQIKTWFLFHLGIGLLGLLTKYIIIFWFYYVLLHGISSINRTNVIQLKHIRIIKLLLYIVPFEIYMRVLKCTPIVPYEAGKYISFFLLVWGIIHLNNIKNLGFIVIILLIPGVFIGLLEVFDYREIIFNVLGLINLGLGVSYFGSLNLTNKTIDINQIMRLILYPLLSTLVYVFFKTPDYDEITFGMRALRATSGGFGSNQVSTAFGLGLFLCFYFWQKKILFTGFNRMFDLFFAMLFLYQGLLTFSRGGIIGGLIGIFLILLLGKRQTVEINGNPAKQENKLKLTFYLLIFFLPLIFFANNITEGNLILRYKGETSATINGFKDKSLNTITSGRFNILNEDIDLFWDNPFLGVGIGVSKLQRSDSKGIVAHVEISRLLSEHGILGLLIVAILLWELILVMIFRERQAVLVVILGIIGFYSTFHAATRTFISPMFISMIYLKKTNLKF